MTELEQQVYNKLLEIRSREDLKLKPNPFLKERFVDYAGEEHPLSLRYYQVQGIMHLLLMRRFVLGDDTGLGKTIQTIAALCFLWEKNPSRKVIVLTTKSAAPQWAAEFARFTRGIRVVVSAGTKKQRHDAYSVWRRSDKPSVLISGYRSVVNDFAQLQDDKGYILVLDEATAFKSEKTQVHQCMLHFSSQADRVWGLTATLLKNHLLEGHGIYQVILPGLFKPYNQFMYYYCIVEMMQIGRNRKVPRVVGYFPEKISEFKEAIDPYYLGRPKHQVASELPVLVQDVFKVGMSAVQATKYAEALSGLLKAGGAEKEVTKLTAITYCQEIVDHPQLIGEEGTSEKMEALLDLLTEGDLAGQKVILFTRFKRMVNILMPALEKAGLSPVRVTGDEDSASRLAAQSAFQDPNSPTRVICITSAGGEGINLQAAKAIVFYDSPWSAGEYIQILGRMIRIGSKHDSVLALHLVTEWEDGPSIDQRVLDVIHSKMTLIEAVLGERLKGSSKDDTGVIGVESEINEIFSRIKRDAEGKRR